MEWMIDSTTWTGSGIILAIALAIAVVLVLVQHIVFVRLGRKAAWLADLGRRVRRPWSALVVIIATWLAARSTVPGTQSWWPEISHLLLVLTIISGAWLLSSVVGFAFEQLSEFEDRATGAEARSRRTQRVVLQRLTQVVIVVITIGAVLFTFPAMRAVGTSLLASAGLVSIVAGLAAQSILGNLIAGLQLAFTDAVRVGDVVVVEGEWGRIGEINLSYVVFHIWDERRLILPCSYFTSNPFETWTRETDNIYGVVLMDLDWRVPMAELRAKFTEIVEGSEWWDGRSAGVVVTGSEGGFVTVRFTMTSKDSSDQWDLRCLVREEIMTWLQQSHPEALPVSRFIIEQPASE